MKTVLGILLLLCPLCAAADPPRPQHVAVNMAGGAILPAYIAPNETSRSSAYGALAFKYGISARGDRWENYLMGMPYWGVGVYVPHFFKDYYGQPFSVFFLQGARIAQITPAFSLNYEVNLGLSFNWRHYDRFRRPDFLALGSAINVHLAGNVHFKWLLSRHVDIRAGLGFNHFSNGAIRTPNNGVNAVSAFVEVACLLFPPADRLPLRSPFPWPAFRKRWVHDVSVLVGTRTLKLEGSEHVHTLDVYPDRRFTTAGIGYSAMWQVSRRFMFGPGLELAYDESTTARVTSGIGEQTGRYWEHVTLGRAQDRFSAGLSLRAELAMPGFSVFAHLGYDVLTRNKRDNRLYQIYGMKVYLYKNLFTSFGVRSTNLSWSRYLFLSVGYSFNRN